VKPAVGFTLPSAGLSPAPSDNRKMARTPFCSQVLFGNFWRASGSYLARYFTGEAAGRIAASGEGSAITAQRALAHFLCHLFSMSFFLVSLQSEAKNPDAVLDGAALCSELKH